MVTLEQLEKIKKLDNAIEMKLLQLKSIREFAMSIGVNLKEVVVQNSGEKDKISSCVVKMIELEREINELTDEFVNLKTFVLDEMEKILEIHTNEYKAIYMKYFEYKRHVTIAVDMNYCPEAVRYFIKKGIKKLSQI